MNPDEMNDFIRDRIRDQIGNVTEDTMEEHDIIFLAVCQSVSHDSTAEEITSIVRQFCE